MTVEGEWMTSLLDRVSDLEKKFAAAQVEIAAMKNVYICTCGLRVEPHRCKTEEEF